ncbi:TPA: hypothetical protein HA251_08045 [Candidatus Woesearchaeota archaeon]|nr:hypothetical protein [Candidatus Woesearchaeota archaeon]
MNGPGTESENGGNMNGNMSEWMLAQHGDYTDTRLASLRTLIGSGLPTYKYHFVPLEEFLTRESEMNAIYDRYGGHVVLRACPLRSGLRRQTIIDKTYAAARQDLDGKPVDAYIAVLNEYDPASFCGVIISDGRQAMVEMARSPNLEDLCHGKITPRSARFSDQGIYHRPRMQYLNTDDVSIRSLMWNAMKSVVEDGLPRKGYYEFVYSSRDKRLRFIDYDPEVTG